MTARRDALGLATGLSLMALSAAFAAAPTGQDAPPAATGDTGISILQTDKPATTRDRQPRGNPLWGIPLSTLSATSERPIFLPSRRSPAPVIANTRSAPPKPVAPPPAERPMLVLIGAVIGENEAIAVLVDPATNGVIRLRTGQNHDGWVLNSVQGRAATLQKDQKTLVLNLPAPGSSPPPVAGVGVPSVPPVPANATTADPNAGTAQGGLVVPDPSIGAPYIPRSAPKDGKSDGL